MKETCIDGGTAGYSELHWLHLWDGEGCALVIVIVIVIYY